MSAYRIYLETTIPSYLVARPSRDPILRGQQEATKQWWRHGRLTAHCYVSEVVENEIGDGDPVMAAQRLEAIRGMPLLAFDDEAADLAGRILATGLIPPKAGTDATHIAIAVVHGMDILLTWNCSHIHNVAIERRIEAVCTRLGYECPVICTPYDLL